MLNLMQDYFSGIGSKIADLRSKKDLTQDELAERAGIPKRTLQSIEYGEVKDPGVGTLNRIIRALGSSFYEIGVDLRDEALKPQKVAEMTKAELEAMISRASKRDGSINLEIAKLKKELGEIKETIPPEVLYSWGTAPAEVKALCLAVLTRKKEFLRLLAEAQLAKLQALLRVLDVGCSKVRR